MTTKEATCIDCRGRFSYEYRTGPPRQRCEPCRTEHTKAQNREKSQRWKDANRDKHVAYLREYHQARKDDPEYRRKRREAMARYSYGITPERLAELTEQQGNRCAICRGERNGPGSRLHIDHCHDSQQVRGLLCGKCNTGVGLFDDNPERLEAAAAYLRRWQKEKL